MKFNPKINNKDEKSNPIHGPLLKNWYMRSAIILAFLSLLFYLSNINHWIEWKYLKNNDNSFVAGLGTLGDYFGGILNPLLTFITIILLIRSIELQRADFKEQLKEQEEQKEVFKKQAIAQNKQATALSKQYVRQKKIQKAEAFERNFFSLLEQHNNLLQQKLFNDELNKLYIDLTFTNRGNISINSYFNYHDLEKIFNDSSYNSVNAYLRFLYRFLKFLSEKENLSSVGIKVHHYADILRSLISEKLLHIIAMNGLRNPSSISGFEKYRRLLEKFYFLEHMNLSILDDIDSGYVTKKKKEFPSLKREIQTFIDYNTFISNQESVSAPLLNLDLQNMRLLNMYIQYRPEAFDQNPYYKNKILPVLLFLFKNKRLPESWLPEAAYCTETTTYNDNKF